MRESCISLRHYRRVSGAAHDRCPSSERDKEREKRRSPRHRHARARKDAGAPRQARPRITQRAREREHKADQREPHAERVQVLEQMRRRAPAAERAHLFEVRVGREDPRLELRAGRIGREPRLDLYLLLRRLPEPVAHQEESGEEGYDGYRRVVSAHSERLERVGTYLRTSG